MIDAFYPRSIASPMQRASDHAARFSATLVWFVLGIGLILSPIGDFLSVYAKNSAVAQGGDARVSLIVRGLMIAGLLTATLGRMRVRRFGIVLTAAVAACVCTTLGAYALGAFTKTELIEQLIFALKVFSFFVYPAAMSLLSDRRLRQIETVVFATLLIYGAAIVLGAVLSIEMFRSYQAQTHIRSGYKGIVNAQNEAAALIVVSLGFGYLHALLRGWSKSNMSLVLCMFIAAMLTGTKGAVVGAMGMTCAYFYSRHSAVKATSRIAVVIGAMIASALLAYLFVPQVNQAVELTMRYFEYQGGRAGGDKMATLLLSGRNLKFANVWDDLRQYDFIPLLTGGYPVVRYMVEIDVPDLALTFGLPVFVIYLTGLYRTFIHRGRSSKGRRFGGLFFCVMLAMASTAGHVLGSAVVSPYIALIAVMIQRDLRNSWKSGGGE
ncbi:hypothetical protein [Burkholderia orbicola]|uniref:hypothetical protein n=1 Tax=Burkholderia orbicola TaxID=2978683 RepID=UPI002651A006|nr:hypothetical protein [Burkholderia orbicola]MDN7557090.1 hypothetical protein [Burkholderia orbicola]